MKCVHGCMHLPLHLHHIHLMLLPCAFGGSISDRKYFSHLGLWLSGQNKGCHSHLWIKPISKVSQRGKGRPEGTRAVKTQDTGPGSWAAYQRNNFSEPRPLLFLLPVLCWKKKKKKERKEKNLLYILTHPLSPQSQEVSKGYLGCCLPGSSPNFVSNKT